MHAQRNGCSTTPEPCSIEQKLRTTISGDEAASDAFLTELNPHLGADSHLGAFERDLLDWGSLFGFAYALARQENPWEPAASVAKRARETAWPVYLDWSGPIADRNIDKPIADLLAAYEKVSNDRKSIPRELADLEDALIGLYNAQGS